MPKLNLFWRTFILLVVLLGGGTLAWLQTYRILELGPQNRAVATQVAELLRVNAMMFDELSEPEQLRLFKALESSEHLSFKPVLASDAVLPFEPRDAMGIALGEAIEKSMGRPVTLAESVNGVKGVWVRIHVLGHDSWLALKNLRPDGPSDKTWLFWMGISGIFSLSGAAAIAQLLNRPLTQIVRATASVRRGNFQAALLDEDVLIHEVSVVNRRFNEMTNKLAQVEADRTLMLAGISHDLRTPLARIRLELELSVSDAQVREDVANDIEQLDHIIDKFMDYARPIVDPTESIAVIPIVEQACQSFANRSYLKITQDMPLFGNPKALVDPVELMRILSNLLENAARYGRWPDKSQAHVHVSLNWQSPWITLTLRDHGPGVPSDMLKRLTEPFYRGDASRSQANGSGLGLAIVAKSLQRMKGRIVFDNHPQGGLMAIIKIRSA